MGGFNSILVPGVLMAAAAAALSYAPGARAEAAPSMDEETILSFTPVQGLIGGAILATAAVARLATTGRLLGVSGVLRGACTGCSPLRESWRLAFLGGLLVGGRLLAMALPDAFEPLVASFTWQRAAVGGLLVRAGRRN